MVVPNEIYEKTLSFLRAHRAEILQDIKRLVDIKEKYSEAENTLLQEWI